MTKKLLFVSVLLLALAFVAAAADVSGKWTWEQAGRQGGNPVQVSLTLKAEGSKLTGTLTRPGRDGMMESPISEGKIDGNNVSFKVTMQFGDNSFTTDYAGAVSGNEMKLKITRPGRDGGAPVTTEVTAKKATT
jgi:opacity protein-like surface antigen